MFSLNIKREKWHQLSAPSSINQYKRVCERVSALSIVWLWKRARAIHSDVVNDWLANGSMNKSNIPMIVTRMKKKDAVAMCYGRCVCVFFSRILPGVRCVVSSSSSSITSHQRVELFEIETHSIRSIGWKIYLAYQSLKRWLCRARDQPMKCPWF